ncbi:hypothetical protein GCM10022223_06930 [Kineosporia mesophila]|uniref:Glycosyltransferase involved in cell wall biosynthesis n=1 Tax=Kineosporia mesophila TaxID=566012 RepID=A0ABP6YZJ8_9ACTN|nr:hypothetical protein [Kineosporia mesophila]MCD5351072.1 hypothetical protein [Kineosporia mesophila]
MRESWTGRSVTHLVVGPPDHGVTIFARWLARHTDGRLVEVPDPGAAGAAAGGSGDAGVHLHYTEALFGPTTGEAAEAFVRLRSGLGERVTVTLHDLPDPADEPGRYRRRALGYGRVALAADAVCVSSEHERARLETLLDRFADAARPAGLRVIPLPVRAPVRPDRWPPVVPEVGVFGFVYPGKGHDDVLEAMAGLPEAVGLTAIGRVADGHGELAGRLTTRAAALGRRLEITGFLPDDQVDERLARVAVPIVPARTISASGSLNTWLSAGRRPLVADGPYTRELDRACPGAVTLYRPGRLAGMIRAVLAEPRLGRLLRPVPGERLESGVAAAYGVFFREAAGPSAAVA